MTVWLWARNSSKTYLPMCPAPPVTTTFIDRSPCTPRRTPARRRRGTGAFAPVGGSIAPEMVAALHGGAVAKWLARHQGRCYAAHQGGRPRRALGGRRSARHFGAGAMEIAWQMTPEQTAPETGTGVDATRRRPSTRRVALAGAVGIAGALAAACGGSGSAGQTQSAAPAGGTAEILVQSRSAGSGVSEVEYWQ